MNKHVYNLLLSNAASCDYLAASCRKDAMNVGEPHHSHLIASAASYDEAAQELRVLLGFSPDEDLLPHLTKHMSVRQ